MKSFAERMVEEGRLVLLQELQRQPNGRLPTRMFRDALEVEGHSFSHEWVRTELRLLKELGLVTLIAVGADEMALTELTEKGEDFLARRIIVEGVKRPIRGG